MYAIGLGLLFFLGAVLAATVLAVPIFLYSLFRGARAFHPRGTVCRAEVVPLDDVVGPRLAGPAVVRLSGAFRDENATAADILGMEIRMRRSGGTDVRDGDQDLAVGTFESFAGARRDLEATDVADYLANQYASVTPWRVRDLGVVWLRTLPAAAPTPQNGANRVERLDAAIAEGRAIFTIEARSAPGPDGAVRARVAELRLLERLTDDGRSLRVSMFRIGRGLIPTGFRNGIRAVVYPVSQAARRLRGG